jgi:hypothetical protein
MGGEIGNTNPGEDEEAGIDGDLVEVGATLLVRPSQVPVSRPDMAGSRTKAYTGNRPVVGESEIVEVFTDRLAIAEVMVLLDKTFVKPFQRSAPHHEDGERLERGEGDVQGGIVEFDPVKPFLAPFEPRGNPLLGRECDMAFGVELEEEAPAHHIFRGSIGLSQVPETAEFLR